MFLAYVFKLKPNKRQVILMSDWLDMLRATYNYCLRDRIEAYEEVKQPRLGEYSNLNNAAPCCPLTCSVSKNTSLGYPWKAGKNKQKTLEKGKKYNPRRSAYDQQASELPILKRTRPWYQQIHSTVLQQNLKRLNEAFKKFFNEGFGYPKFKRRSRFRSFSYPPGQVQLNNNAIYLPSIGWCKFFKSREIPVGFQVKTVTVRRKADGWYVSLRLEDKTVPNPPKIQLSQIKTAIGADLGLNKLVSLSNGETVKNPKFFERIERKLKIRQRKASRKKKGSKNRSREYQKLSKLYQYVTNQKQDYHWKTAHQLCRDGELIVFENLNIKGMIKRCKTKQDENGKYLKNGQSAKAKLNRLITDASWGEFKGKVESLTEKLGLHFLEIDPKYTSRQCNHCGHTAKDNRDKEKFLCVECGNFDDADINAAKNILQKGLKLLNISHIQLPLVRGKVTAKESILETSFLLENEPSNPTKKSFKQLSLFDLKEWSVSQ